MGDYKFFYPNGEEIEGESPEERFHNFIKFYSRVYYYTCSRFVEDEIDRLLDEGIREKMDVVHIMAWKLNKIKVECSTSEKPFVYTEDWGPFNEEPNINWDEVKLKNNGKPFLIEELAKSVCQIAKTEHIENDDVADAAVNIVSKYNGIGSVYSIALLYFLSKGKYPIYDRFAPRGLEAIEERKKPRDKVSIKTDVEIKNIMKEGSRYMEYARKIWDIEECFRKCGKRYGDLKERDLDRALWTYGHLFNV